MRMICMRMICIRMKEQMEVRMAAIQICCEVGDVSANLRNAERLIKSASQSDARFICLPELFTTGVVFGEMEHLAEPIPGPTTRQLGKIAQSNSVYLVAGMAEKDEQTGRLYNANVLVAPNGELAGKYRKIFLYLDEQNAFTPGSEPCAYSLPFGRIGMTICYDFVFPEYIRHLVLQEGIALLVHSTAWLTTYECERWGYNSGAYRAMGMTRALENSIYFISANHWGNYDTAGTLRGIGQSSIISPWGEILDEVVEGEGIAIADVDFKKPEAWRTNVAPYLSDYRQVARSHPFLKDAHLTTISDEYYNDGKGE